MEEIVDDELVATIGPPLQVSVENGMRLQEGVEGVSHRIDILRPCHMWCETHVVLHVGDISSLCESGRTTEAGKTMTLAPHTCAGDSRSSTDCTDGDDGGDPQQQAGHRRQNGAAQCQPTHRFHGVGQRLVLHRRLNPGRILGKRHPPCGEEHQQRIEQGGGLDNKCFGGIQGDRVDERTESEPEDDGYTEPYPAPRSSPAGIGNPTAARHTESQRW